jgi:hypothetical protein
MDDEQSASYSILSSQSAHQVSSLPVVTFFGLMMMSTSTIDCVTMRLRESVVVGLQADRRDK